MKLSSKNIIIICMIMLVGLSVVLIPLETWARAGGGGGGRGNRLSGILYIIYFTSLSIYYGIISHFIAKKFRHSRALLELLAKRDTIWNFDDIKHRIKTTYFKVQEAWMKRDQSIARNYVSDRLFEIHKMQTDLMIKQGRINVLKDINLIGAAIVQVADYIDDNKDSLCVYIKGSMIDYKIDEKTKEIVDGDDSNENKFKELWKFVRHPQHGWVLDEIEQEVKLSEIVHFHSFSEDAQLSSDQLEEYMIKDKKQFALEWKPLKLINLNMDNIPFLVLIAVNMLPFIILSVIMFLTRSTGN